MLRLLLRQPLNAWKSLGWRHKIEILLLALVIYAYLITRLDVQFASWLAQDQATPTGLALLILHVFTLSYALTGPFIIRYLLPRQKGLHPFYGQALEKGAVFTVLGYFYARYQLIHFLLFLPVWLALMLNSVTGGILLLLLFPVYAFLFFNMQISRYIRQPKKFRYLIVQVLFIILFHALFAAFYWLWQAALWFEPAALLLISFFARRFYNRPGPVNLETIFPLSHKTFGSKTRTAVSFSSVPVFLPKRLQVLFNKELMRLWRNAAYRRLKIITLILYAVILALLALRGIPNLFEWSALFTAILIWLHYGNHFSEKYVQPEPVWYFQTLPLSFSGVWLSKFLVEFFYILLLMVVYLIFLLLSGAALPVMINFLLLLLLFAVIVLALMLNFQIMFYEAPRLAGYAWHFTVVFLSVMSLNYRFVGPLISIFLIVFYFYKNYRYMNS